MAIKYLIGIDEAGRGPLAGPVTIGLLLVPVNEHENLCREFFGAGIKDSKKLSPRKREIIFGELGKWQKKGKLRYFFVHVGPNVIDKVGISLAIKKGIDRVIAKTLVAPDKCRVRLDGLLSAPDIFVDQQTIIKGDETEAVIALASVVAKVSRDRYMLKLGRQYPDYGLDNHKGYGTKYHLEALKKYGPSQIHRWSYLGRVLGVH